MAQRSRVPQFGKWNAGEDVAYTVYFEKAREQRGVGGMKVGNPNDPQENPDLHPNSAHKSKFDLPPAYKPMFATEESRGPGPARTAQEPRARAAQEPRARAAQEPRARAEDSNLRRSIEPSVHRDNAASPTNGEPYKRRTGPNPNNDHSAERSPLRHQAKASGGAAYRSSPGANGRSRIGADDSLSSGTAVPRFGEWNVNDPASGDGYTNVFKKIMDEKQRGPAPPGPNVSASPHSSNRKPRRRDNPKSCCFPWL